MKNAHQNIVEHKMKSFNVLIHPANSSNSKNIQFADREMLQMLSCEDLKPVWSDSPQRTAFQLCHIHILFKNSDYSDSCDHSCIAFKGRQVLLGLFQNVLENDLFCASNELYPGINTPVICTYALPALT